MFVCLGAGFLCAPLGGAGPFPSIGSAVAGGVSFLPVCVCVSIPGHLPHGTRGTGVVPPRNGRI
jgi:hypothetical protein